MQPPQPPYDYFVDDGSFIIGDEEQYQAYLQQQFAASQAQSTQSVPLVHDHRAGGPGEQRQEAIGAPKKSDEHDTSSRPRLTAEQTRFFEQRYREDPRPKTETKAIFARDLGLHIDKVNNWFQNRRAKSRHLQKIQSEYLEPRNAQWSDMSSAPSSMLHFHASETQAFAPDPWSSMADYAAIPDNQPGLHEAWEVVEDSRVLHESSMNLGPLAPFPPPTMPSTITPSETELFPASSTYAFDHMKMDLPLRRAGHLQSAEDASSCSLSHSLGTLTTQTSIATSENEEALHPYASCDPLANMLNGWEGISAETFESEVTPRNGLGQTRTTTSPTSNADPLPQLSDRLLNDESLSADQAARPSLPRHGALQQPGETLQLSRSNLAARRNRQRPAPLRSASSAMPHLLSPVSQNHSLRHAKSTGYGMNLSASRIHKQGGPSNPRSPLNRSTFHDDGVFDRVASFVDQQAHELRVNAAELTPSFHDSALDTFLSHRLPYTPPDSNDQRYENLMIPSSASLCPDYGSAANTPLSQAFSHSLTHTSPSSFHSMGHSFDHLNMPFMAPPQSAPAHLAHFPATSPPPPSGHVPATTFYDASSQVQQCDMAAIASRYQAITSSLQQASSILPSPRTEGLYAAQSQQIYAKGAPTPPIPSTSPSVPLKKEQEWEFVHHDQAQMAPSAVSIPLHGQPLVFQFVGPENFREGRETKGR